jgi:signal transduction histidine kinase/CheY-like chemotaxis protein
MSIKNNKSVSFVFLIASVIIFSFFIYNIIIVSSECNEKKKHLNHILLIEKIDHIINKIEKERIYSAIYLGIQEEATLNQVDSSRKIVDQEIEETFLFLKENSIFSNQRIFLREMSITLTEIRKKIDLLNSSYQINLFENYKKRIITPLNQKIQQLGQNFSFEHQNELDVFQSLIKIKENLNKETSFIAFVLSHSKKMTLSELHLWERIIHDDISPDFHKLENTRMLKKLYENMNPLYFSNIKNHERAEIFNHALKGNYKISIEKWIHVSASKIDKINVAQKMLFINIKSSLHEIIIVLEERIMKLALSAIFFFLLILMILYLSYNLRRTSLYLTETLKDIEAELNEKQRLEIHEVIKKNDTIEIYKFLANAIKEPSREKDNFLANMSHEIRTPLNGIIGFTNLLKLENLKDEPLEFVNIIEESSNNLLHIVNDILDFAKVSSGKIEVEEISFNIMEKFESCIDSYTIKATQKNIELGLFIDPSLPTEIIGDPTKISQVLLNLLSNAIKFTPNEGQVNISIEKISETTQNIDIRFTIKDSGIGIEEKKKSTIFDAFSQADASTNRKFGGTGLGLTISSKFVELMNGKLEIKSKPNNGSTFFFTLNLKRSLSAKAQIRTNYSNLTIGYIKEEHLLYSDIDENLKAYIKHFRASFKVYTLSELFQSKFLPDILFINDRYISSKELLKRCLRLETKTVLITTPNGKNHIEVNKNKIAKIIYKPINFSKTMHTLELLRVTKTSNKQKKQEELQAFTNMNILIAEDNIINQKLIVNILKNLETNISIASNGQEVVKLFKENRYDIVLMDIEMPIMSGVEATIEIIAYEKEFNKPHTPIVALTANTLQKDKERYLANGMDEYLEKPLQIKNLKAILQKYFLLTLGNREEKAKHILLYTETKVSGKIYEAILNNLGYKVDISYSEDEFKKRVSNKQYEFALFDAKPLSKLITEESQNAMVSLIKSQGTIPFAFTEERKYKRYCKTIRTQTNPKELEEFLKEA